MHGISSPVPLVDLKLQISAIGGELSAAVADVVSSCHFVGGPAVDAFAGEFAAYCGIRHAIPCSNGTEALRLGLVAVLGEGDRTSEIITVSHTFPATVEAIIAAGYRPVLVDVDPTTYLMDLDQLEPARTSRTVAVVPVHLYGQMVDMERLSRWSRRHGLAIVEDAAQAPGARSGVTGPGHLSDAAAFSFYPGKNLGAWGDAGAVISNDHAVATGIAQLLDHGRTDKFTHSRIGCNARMDAIQAAVLRVKLRYLDRWNDARRQAAAWYSELLRDDTEFALPAVAKSAKHVYHQYVVQVNDRQRLQKALGEGGIATGVHYPVPVHEQPAYQYLGIAPDALPATHALCRRVLSLPMFPEITHTQVKRVAAALRVLSRPTDVQGPSRGVAEGYPPHHSRAKEAYAAILQR